MPEIVFDEIDASAKGSYVLVVRLAEDRTIPVGKRGVVLFRAGYYAYSGSALGGLKARVSRHLRRDKNRHWHIDYLLEAASIEEVLTIESPERLECKIARVLGETFDVIAGFGSSDCRCPGHLLFSETPVTETIMEELAHGHGYPVRLATGWREQE